jgi:hypothetical protein
MGAMIMVSGGTIMTLKCHVFENELRKALQDLPLGARLVPVADLEFDYDYETKGN